MSETYQKKLGLGLSGGGFRASLFHIGVLACLAENDMLKDVEVISCVSGGSIIGAYYYLHLKKLLESKKDSEILIDDYIRMIKEIEVDFLKEVQTNLRVQVLSSLKSNFRMLYKKEYSQSDRMAELYDRHFFNKFLKDFDINKDNFISMSELLIKPCESPIEQDIRKYNLLRKNKVPMIILNATTLNTGRNWQITAVDMGEREEVIEESNLYNKNALFKAFKFKGEEIKKVDKKYLEFPLRIAVAASACVPGLFTPLALTLLYKDCTPKLVDGGVYDNQGISPIIYEECTEIIISDASGQLNFFDNVRDDPIGVSSRANSILMNRIRNLQFGYILDKFKSHLVENEVFLHLKEDLDQQKIGPGDIIKEEYFNNSKNTYYNINQQVQYLLSKIRTDLDSFTEIEAYSLMYSGYSMTKAKIQSNYLLSPKFKSQEWDFMRIKKYCENKNPNDEIQKKYIKQLSNGQETMFKSTKISSSLMTLEFLIFLFSGLVAFAPLIIVSIIAAKSIFFSIILSLYIGSIIIFLLSLAIRFFKNIKNNILYKISTTVILFFYAISGWIISRLYLICINNKFNKLGSLESLESE